MRYVANLTTQYFKCGEVVELDPDLWQLEIDAGMLSPVDEHGERIVAAQSTLDLDGALDE